MNNATMKRLQCRCGRGDTVRVPGGGSAMLMDLRHGLARIDLTGFPLGWRTYVWRTRDGHEAHRESVCPDCPAPQRKDGTKDTDAVEIARS